MNKIVRMKFGSHLYGLNTPESDTDCIGIYMPTFDELLLNSYKPEIKSSTGNSKSRNTKDDIDDDWISLPKFLALALKGETMTIDMLHATDVEVGQYGFIWHELVKNRKRFYTQNLSSYMGYVKHQAAKYGIRGSRIAAMREAIEMLTTFNNEHNFVLNDIWAALPVNEYCKKILIPKKGKPDEMEDFYEINAKKYAPTNKVAYVLERVEKALDGYGARALLAEKNEGVDWKAVSHAFRAGYQMRAIYSKGDFEYPLGETDFILQVKKGELDYLTEVAPVLEALVDEVDSLAAMNEFFNLPKHSDKEYWDKWLIKMYKLTVVDEYAFPEGH